MPSLEVKYAPGKERKSPRHVVVRESALSSKTTRNSRLIPGVYRSIPKSIRQSVSSPNTLSRTITFALPILAFALEYRRMRSELPPFSLALTAGIP